MTTQEIVRAPHLADWALARGASALTTRGIAEVLGVPVSQVSERLAAPVARQEWVSPVRGLWLPVPPEFRLWGAPPGIEVVDLVAAHLELDYYVGWLSAAHIHGAAHQSPQVFQVAVSRPLRDRTVGRTDFQFHRRGDVMHVPVVLRETRSGTARVSTPEATALDVARDVSLAGGIDNAATVILELDEAHGLGREEIAQIVSNRPGMPIAALRRLGYVLDRLGERPGLEPLRAAVASGPPTPARLDPSSPATGPVDDTWLVRRNRDVEVDW